MKSLKLIWLQIRIKAPPKQGLKDANNRKLSFRNLKRSRTDRKTLYKKHTANIPEYTVSAN